MRDTIQKGDNKVQARRQSFCIFSEPLNHINFTLRDNLDPLGDQNQCKDHKDQGDDARKRLLDHVSDFRAHGTVLVGVAYQQISYNAKLCTAKLKNTDKKNPGLRGCLGPGLFRTDYPTGYCEIGAAPVSFWK